MEILKVHLVQAQQIILIKFVAKHFVIINDLVFNQVDNVQVSQIMVLKLSF